MEASESHGAIVGAYAASPAHSRWNPALEKEFFTFLDAVPTVRGLELPWLGSLHPHDDRWLEANLPRRFSNVVTDIGATVSAVAADPAYGLASTDARGRRAAIHQASRLRDDVHRLNDAIGAQSVLAVELHSAPLASAGSAGMLRASLTEVAGWDWDGATLTIEHCDSEVAGQAPEKGYLSLADELDAIASSGTGIGLSLNWGRSAIELRRADAVRQQVAMAASSGLLRGLMFSGASDRAGRFGPAWIDAHLPMAPTPEFPLGEPTSLLTEELLRECVDAAGDVQWSGIKYGWKPQHSPVVERVQMVTAGVDILLRSFRRP